MHACRVVHQRRRTKEQSVDDREHRGVGTDAEREREHHRDGERRPVAQPAEGVADVLATPVEPADAAGVAMFLADLFHTAKGDPRPPSRLLQRHALGARQFFGLKLEMETDLFIQFAVDRSAVKEGAEAPLELCHCDRASDRSVSWREATCSTAAAREAPRRALGRKLFQAERGERVGLGATPFRTDPPFGGDPSPGLPGGRGRE